MNSEIQLDLPCDEFLYSAETAQEWQSRGGLAAESNAVPFAHALGILLTANERRKKASAYSNAYNSHNEHYATQDGIVSPEADLRPSTFGCLVLINALHNYIWETRSRHTSRQWTAQETDSMFSHIEPALSAWETAWKANEHHKVDRPNQFGPLAADSVPLLDLAYIRLFVNLGKSKEAFWKRDFEKMAEELAHGSEIAQHADPTPVQNRRFSLDGGTQPVPAAGNSRQSQSQLIQQQNLSRRERHLRKAAHYAADALFHACKSGVTYTDPTAHELPVQSAMCFFDCSQVLAEWACTVQERVGSTVGIIGKDDIDFGAVPAVMMLEYDDIELFNKIKTICQWLESKRFQQENILSINISDVGPDMMMDGVHNGVCLSNCGFGSKILRITAMMLEKAVVWPVTHVMAKALETQAAHMDHRAEASISQ